MQQRFFSVQWARRSVNLETSSVSARSGRFRRVLSPTASGIAALSANLAAGCVGLFAPLGVAITSVGLDWLHVWDVQQPIVYAATALSLAALAHAAWRHRQPLLLALGGVSAGALLYPLHDALDVMVFRWLLNGGAAGLLAAAVWSVALARRPAKRGEQAPARECGSDPRGCV